MNELNFPEISNKTALYETIIPQIASVVEKEEDFIANLANISSILKTAFGFFWVGFYLVKKEDLVLGPFQGTLACTRIKYGKGVCGMSWQKSEPICVADVDSFPGHIACSSLSRSEIVVPIVKEANVIGVLDVDSDKISAFDEIDKNGLIRIANIVASIYK